ncbi:MAG: tRNA (cytidine(34)-2'-O)-methyltransferase [Christensenellales bacterium]
MFHIVLVEPQIPQNTGNIVRTCAVTGAQLHLVKPLGFSIEDRYLKRAGLDYWCGVDVSVHDNFYCLQKQFPGGRFFYFTTHGALCYAEQEFLPGDFLVFGSETAGLSKDILNIEPAHCLRMPMREGYRCLNLSNAVAVALYEALRQNRFMNLT